MGKGVSLVERLSEVYVDVSSVLCSVIVISQRKQYNNYLF